MLWSLHGAGAGRGDLVNPGGWTLMARFWRAAVHPDLSGAMLRATADGAVTTVAFAVVGTALSVVIGLVGGVLVSETWWRRSRPQPGRTAGTLRPGWVVGRGLCGLPRGIHEAVWGLFLVNVLGRDPLVGVLAIAIPFGAITAKVYGELIDECPSGPYDGLRQAGAGRLGSLAYGVFPALRPDLVSYAFYRLECSIRSAVILGMIGAGGLGFQLNLSFQSLDYRAMWTVIYALVTISALADAWGAAIRRQRNPFARARGLPVALGLVLVGASFARLGPDLGRLASSHTRELLSFIVRAGWPPTLPPDGWSGLARRAAETVQMSVLAIAIGGFVAVGAAFLAARGGRSVLRRTTSTACRVALLVTRAIPPPVWALLVLFVLFPGPLPGAVALGIYNFGILGRLMAEAIENLDPGPADALRASGAAESAVFAYARLPMSAARLTAFALYRWEVAVRETVVVGVVGAGGLGRLLEQQRAAFNYAGMTATVIALIIVSIGVDVVSAYARRALR